MSFLGKKKSISMLVLASIATYSLLSAPVNAESLLQVYEQAKKNDAQLKISEAGFRVALENKPQVLSNLKPRANLNADASYNLNYTDFPRGRDDGSAFLNVGYDLTLTKSLINHQLKSQISQIDASILQSKALLESDRQDLIIRVAEAYFNYLNANETLSFRKSEKVAIGRQLTQAKAFFEAGRSAITDVKEAQARYDLANAQIELAKQQIDVARESLKAITTHYYKNLDGAADNIPLLIPKPNDINAWTKVALANSKPLIAASHAVDAAQDNVDIERAARKPTVNIVARHAGSTRQGEDTVDRDSIDASIGVQLSMPLYQGGNISSRIRQARHQLHQSRQQLVLQKRLASQQARAAYLTIVSELSQVKALKQALNSTQAAANATQAGFEAGTRTAVDVLLALRETFSAKRDYTTARYSFLLNTLRLKRAVGTLSESDLAAVSKLLKKKLR